MLYYGSEIKKRFNSLEHCGILDKNDFNVGIGKVGSAACGDAIVLSIYVVKGIITDAKMLVFGCGSAIASGNVLIEMLKGKTVEFASSITNSEIAKKLSLPKIKIHCSCLCEEAIKAALHDYLEKQKTRPKEETVEAKQPSNPQQPSSQKETECQSCIKPSLFNHKEKLSDDFALIFVTMEAYNAFMEVLKPNESVFLGVKFTKCGANFFYRIVEKESLIGDSYCTINVKEIGFKCEKKHLAYISGLVVGFIAKQLDRAIVFEKSDNCSSCLCGRSFKL